MNKHILFITLIGNMFLASFASQNYHSSFIYQHYTGHTTPSANSSPLPTGSKLGSPAKFQRSVSNEDRVFNEHFLGKDITAVAHLCDKWGGHVPNHIPNNKK